MYIKLKNLEKLAKQAEERNNYIFQDLQLDIKIASKYDPNLQIRVFQNDLAVSLDEKAIRNSLQNLFGTKPGQRFLFPRYGLNFDQFLFDPVTDLNGEILGETIVRAIETFEQRVEVVRCFVTPKPDENLYDVSLVIFLAALQNEITINSILDLDERQFLFSDKSN